MINKSVKRWFVIGNILLLVAIIASIARDESREWKKYQKGFTQREVERLTQERQAAKDEDAKARLGKEIAAKKATGYEIKQIILNDLGRVDRCITCHVGMDPLANPSMKTEYTENPYKGHPGDFLAKHSPSKYGCTVCHAGQGTATTMKDAHGKVKHWEEPLIEAPFIQGSCVKCHANFESIPYTQVATKGKELINKNGCLGCHTIKGFGGVIGDDLSEIASKPLSRIDFSNSGLPHEERSTKNWIYKHLTMDPAALTPGDPDGHRGGGPIAPSGMQPFFKWLKPGEADAITAYLMSMTSLKIPHDFYVYQEPKPEPKLSGIENGKYVFHKYGCQACHGVDAMGGRRNFNALGPKQDPNAPDQVAEMLKGEEPNLRKTVGTFNREELRAKIQNGVPPNEIVKFKEDGPTPPLYMPAWKEKIKGQELEDLMSYLFSIAERSEDW